MNPYKTQKDTIRKRRGYFPQPPAHSRGADSMPKVQQSGFPEGFHSATLRTLPITATEVPTAPIHIRSGSAAAAQGGTRNTLPQVQASRYDTPAPQITHMLSQGNTAGAFRNNSSRFAHTYGMPFDMNKDAVQNRMVSNTAETIRAEAGTMQGNGSAAEGTMNGSAFTNTSVPESVHTAKTSPHLYNNMPVDTPSLSPEDREAARMTRINENYEHDRAVLAREKTPALARSDTHDVGHAEGMEDSDGVTDPKKLGKKLTMQLIDRAKGVIL